MKLIYLTLSLVCTLMLSAQQFPATPNANPSRVDEFNLYPNPAVSDVVYITTDLNDTKRITIYDVFGKIVLRDRIASSALNISRLVPGVYVLQVQEREKTMTRKLVVK